MENTEESGVQPKRTAHDKTENRAAQAAGCIQQQGRFFPPGACVSGGTMLSIML